MNASMRFCLKILVHFDITRQNLTQTNCIKDTKYHYSYITSYCADLPICTKELNDALEDLLRVYILKWVSVTE